MADARSDISDATAASWYDAGPVDEVELFGPADETWADREYVMGPHDSIAWIEVPGVSAAPASVSEGLQEGAAHGPAQAAALLSEAELWRTDFAQAEQDDALSQAKPVELSASQVLLDRAKVDELLSIEYALAAAQDPDAPEGRTSDTASDDAVPSVGLLPTHDIAGKRVLAQLTRSLASAHDVTSYQRCVLAALSQFTEQGMSNSSAASVRCPHSVLLQPAPDAGEPKWLCLPRALQEDSAQRDEQGESAAIPAYVHALLHSLRRGVLLSGPGQPVLVSYGKPPKLDSLPVPVELQRVQQAIQAAQEAASAAFPASVSCMVNGVHMAGLGSALQAVAEQIIACDAAISAAAAAMHAAHIVQQAAVQFSAPQASAMLDAVFSCPDVVELRPEPGSPALGMPTMVRIRVHAGRHGTLWGTGCTLRADVPAALHRPGAVADAPALGRVKAQLVLHSAMQAVNAERAMQRASVLVGSSAPETERTACAQALRAGLQLHMQVGPVGLSAQFFEQEAADALEAGSAATPASSILTTSEGWATAVSDAGSAVELAGAAALATAQQQLASARDTVPADSALTPVMAFGAGQYGSAGDGKFAVRQAPTLVRWNCELGLPRITQISVGWYHCAAVSDTGQLYTWGSGASGALGHGDTTSVSTPRLVEYFGLQRAAQVRQVACGGSSAGAHTVALLADSPDEPACVFEWGTRPSSGVYAAQDSALPAAVPSVDMYDEEECGIVQVCAGSGFSAVVTGAGHVWTWGRLAHGRLGYMPEQQSSALSASRRTAPAKYNPHPRQVELRGPAAQPSSSSATAAAAAAVRIVQLACGNAHCIAVSSAGELWSWGRGDAGQLGWGKLVAVGVPRRVRVRQLRAAAASTGVPPADPHAGISAGASVRSASTAASAASAGARVVQRVPVLFVQVAAGASHSLAISTDGALWTWGGKGGAMLGHGDVTAEQQAALRTLLGRDAEPTRERGESDSSTDSDGDRAEAVSLARLEQARAQRVLQPWMAPRPVLALASVWTVAGAAVCSIAAGVQHSCAVTTDGQLYVWGANEHGALGLPASVLSVPVPSLAGVLAMRAAAEPVHMRSAQFMLSQLASQVGAGGWTTLALLQGPRPGKQLAGIAPTSSVLHAGVARLSTACPPDVMLHVEEFALPAHAVVLAGASARFSAMLLAQRMRGAGTVQTPAVIAMSSISARGLTLLLTYLYTGTLPALQFSAAELQELHSAGEEFGIAGLAPLAAAMQSSQLLCLLSDPGVQADELIDALDSTRQISEQHPVAQLNAALLACPSMTMGESQLASAAATGDLALLSGPQRMFAHSIVLLSKSRYFYTLLHDELPELQKGSPVELQLPDAPDTVARMLYFAYTGCVREDTATAPVPGLLRDLVAADRYAFKDWRSVLQSMVQLEDATAAQVLEISDAIQAAALRERALQFILARIASVSVTPAFKRMSQRAPRLVHALAARIRLHTSSVSHALVAQSVARRKQRELDEESEQPPAKFPWLSMAVLLGLLAVFSVMRTLTVSTSYVVPAVNVVALAGMLVFGVTALGT